VVIFQEPSFCTLTTSSHEGAPTFVASPDFSFHLGRDVAGSAVGRCRGARSTRLGTSTTLHIVEQYRESAIEDFGWIAVRNRVSQEGLKPAELVMSLA
jgi:hypothetical protein